MVVDVTFVYGGFPDDYKCSYVRSLQRLETDLEAAPVSGRALHVDFSPVRLRDPLDNGKPQAATDG